MDLDEIADKAKHWDPRDRAAAYDHLKDVLAVDIQHWFCDRPRICDGKPHEGFDYKHARGDQWPPEGNDWFIWFLMSGRGAGKTRSGSGWVRAISRKVPRIAGIGRRGQDVRQTMVEGRSGLIAACEAAGESYDWKPALKEFTFESGAKFYGFSAEEPDSLRGPEHGAAWLDEPAHMPLINEVWYNLGLGLRIPGMPGGAKILLTSTPLPTKFVKEIVKKPTTRLVRVSTDVNLDNLDPMFIENVVEPLRGTRIGRQELNGEILEDVEGALWHGDMILRSTNTWEDMERIVIAIDPAGTANKKSDLTGIVAVGKIGKQGYVLADLSGRYSPAAWAKAADDLYTRLSADAIVVETNFGGDMVKQNLRAHGSSARIIEARATRGKQVRAEPIVNLYEQGRFAHTQVFADLEDEMTTWIPGEGPSPNRVDALVWGATELFKPGGTMEIASARTLTPAGPPPSRFENPIARLRRERMG